MHALLIALFWGSAALILYTYLVYPCLLWLLAMSKGPPRPIPPLGSLPSISLLVSAYNEAAVIGEKIMNAFGLQYPEGRMEILVGSDGSTDRTAEIASGLHGAFPVRVYSFPRRGKTWVLNDLARLAHGDILVFSDANSIFAADALEQLVRHFAEEGIGCVSGLLHLRKKGAHVGAEGESFYWRYETFKKRRENVFRAVAGANGAIYAIRRELFEPLPPRTINDDFTTSMRVYLKGYRIALAEHANAYEFTASDFKAEFQRHVRDSAGHFQALWELRGLFNPLLGMPCFCYVSHRAVRWAVPFLMLAAYFSSALLSGAPLYLGLFALQTATYAAIAAATPYVLRGGNLGLLYIPYYFVTVNFAIIVGFLKFCAGSQTSAWQPAARHAT